MRTAPRTSSQPRLAAAAGVLLLGFASCGGAGAIIDSQYADEALDSTDTAQMQSALLVPATNDAAPAMTPDQLAASAVAKAGNYYQPASCVTASAAGATVTYKLDNCTGPHGLVRVTGSVFVTLASSAQWVTANITSKGLRVNGAILDLDAQAVYSVDGETKKLSMTSVSSGTGIRGISFTHGGNYDVTWDATCMSLDGSWETKVGSRTWGTAVAGYKRCSGQCPSAGGSVVYGGGLAGVTVTVTFDGGTTAKWASSRGRSGTVLLNCGQ